MQPALNLVPRAIVLNRVSDNPVLHENMVNDPSR